MIVPGLVGRKNISPDCVIKNICFFYNVSELFVKENAKKKTIIRVRHMCMYFLREKTPMNLKAIGAVFKKDHTTVLHAINKIKGYIDINDPETTEDIKQINFILNN